MKNLLNPKWLLLIHTAPVLLLAFLLSAQYSIIKSALSEENIFLCIIFASSLFLLTASTLTYTTIQIVKKKPLSIYYGFASLLTHLIFLYVYCNYLSEMVPLSTPLWILGDDVIIYVGTFLMPAMAHAILIIVMWLTPADKKHKPWMNLLWALLIPMSWYIFGQLILPLWRMVDFPYDFHVIIVLATVSTIVFLFFLIRILYIITVQKITFFIKYPLAWKIPLSFIFPILGLLFNSGWFFNGGDFTHSHQSIFGNFNSIWFYILALVNGLFICLSNREHRLYRLFLLVGRSVLFAYTFYFFLVFLPYLPFSVLLILAAGAGFLMLTPLVLFVVHLQELSADIQYLRQYYSTAILYSISIIGFTVLPIVLILDNLNDRSVLHEALHYVYSPNYEESVDIDTASLTKTIEVLKNHKDRTSVFQRSTQTPYLSTVFKWIVLDNMSLSDHKIQTLEHIFLGHSKLDRQFPSPPANPNTMDQVKLTHVKSHSIFNKASGSWMSTIDLELTNTSKDSWQQEYETTVELPEGCWISDYYLYIGNRKEKGLLAEKKAAIWVYSQIVNTRQDPGILYYLTGNKVALRVFPFTFKEVRKTGLEFIHKEPVNLTIDGQVIHLGKTLHGGKTQSEKINDQVFYVSVEDKKALPIIQRKPYYHFVVDVSKENNSLKIEYIQRIENLLSQQVISGDNAQISFTNSYTHTIPFDQNWKAHLQNQNCSGGFYLEHAIRHILTNEYLHPKNTYPIITVVTDSLPQAILDKDFASLKFTSPENKHFYSLTAGGMLEPHDLFNNPKAISSDSLAFSFDNKVFAWPNEKNVSAYLPLDDQPSIVLKGSLGIEHPALRWTDKNYSAALYMQGEWMSQVLYPHTSEKQWLDVVKQSFQTKVMSPYTSYLVVESEMQKEMILKKQKQTLAGNKSLDLGEEPQRMSEPELVVVALLFLAYFTYKQKKKQQSFMPIQ
ncbi:MAG: MSEP-CTERM sorting domain-containing protein [Cytophagaceae bacterium]|nr:MSEP-CTERM sorting domain-containing protein [Cytophagaceae bacterium]